MYSHPPLTQWGIHTLKLLQNWQKKIKSKTRVLRCEFCCHISIIFWINMISSFLVSIFISYKSPQVYIGERKKKSHLQIVSSFVSGTAPQLPSEQVFIYSCRQSHVFMRINPKLAHRLAGTDCIFYHMSNSWRIYPQKIETKHERGRPERAFGSLHGQFH